MEIKKHPIYSDYGCDEFGNIYSFKRKNITKIKQQYTIFGYLLTKISYGKSFNYSSHKFIWECFNGKTDLSVKSGEGLTIDHINGIKDDNSINNLTILQHRENIRKDKNRGYIGVYYRKDMKNKIYSAITIEGKSSRLGYFGSEIEAAKAYDDKYENIHGIRPNKTIKNI